MKSGLYIKFALNNIKKNKRSYLPYMISTVFCVMMIYQMLAFSFSKASEAMQGIAPLMAFGLIIVMIFTTIFLFYTNSFLMKQRQKEIGVYNILGMEKKHIGKMMIYEAIIILMITLLIGMVLGIVGFYLSVYLFNYIINQPMDGFIVVDGLAVLGTIAYFAALFLLVLLSNLGKVVVAKPVQLLMSKSSGEKEPKTKFILFLIGIISLVTGYFIALNVEYGLEALFMFFVAVLFVIVGTYCLFIAGSIAILKMLKKNKSFYYKPTNFTSVSGMIYRMKKNAVGLANICILSCMVLVSVGTTTAMFVGAPKAIERMMPENMSVTVHDLASSDEQQFSEVIAEFTEENNIEQYYQYESYVLGVDLNHSAQVVRDSAELSPYRIIIMTASDYNQVAQTNYTVKDYEMIVADNSKSYTKDLPLVANSSFAQKDRVDFVDKFSASPRNTAIILVKDHENMQQVLTELKSDSTARYTYLLKTTDDAATLEKYTEALNTKLDTLPTELYSYANVSEINEISSMYYIVYGSLFFLGLFLGSLFLIMAVVIIYYKQVTEGMMDKRRFMIMQQVGMSKKEVRRSINKQIRMVFFLPLIVAFIHISFAYKMMSTVLLVLGIDFADVVLYSILGISAIYAVIYLIVYKLTSRTYYQIIGKNNN